MTANMTANRIRGTVAALSRKRNFVLIRPDGEEMRVYCHRSEVEHGDAVKEGVTVEFDVWHDSRHLARNVQLLGV